jgi:RNA polymerase sigma-70 factor (ECF subfamily)
VTAPADGDERELIDRCRSGDDGAFAELVDRYKDVVYGLIYRMVSDRSIVEDLAQDVFLKVHRGLPYFRGEARLSTWIYRITHNVCTNVRMRPRREVPLEDDARGATARASLDPGSADAAFSTMEARDRLDKAMAKLPDNYRFLIAAHYLKGTHYEALAETLNIPLGTVKTHLHRARRQLRELLEGGS